SSSSSIPTPSFPAGRVSGTCCCDTVWARRRRGSSFESTDSRPTSGYCVVRCPRPTTCPFSTRRASASRTMAGSPSPSSLLARPRSRGGELGRHGPGQVLPYRDKPNHVPQHERRYGPLGDDPSRGEGERTAVPAPGGG